MHLWKFIVSSEQNDVLLKVLVVLAAILAYLMIKNKRLFSPIYSGEGFEQNDKFVYKCGANAIFDDFYADVYDKIFEPEVLAPIETDAILATQPDKENSVILDVSSGTGHLVAELTKRGFERTFGVDNSKEMVAKSREIHPSAKTKHADITQPLAFEPSTFTHIVMSNFAIYRHEDKPAVLRNMASWLQPYGYLCIHLVDPDRFDPIVPAAKPLVGSGQPKNGERITDTFIDFDDFTYKSEFTKKKGQPMGTFRETFTDSASGHLRQNDLTMWMEPVNVILRMAKHCGFDPIAQFDVKTWSRDEHQHLYILQKTG